MRRVTHCTACKGYMFHIHRCRITYPRTVSFSYRNPNSQFLPGNQDCHAQISYSTLGRLSGSTINNHVSRNWCDVILFRIITYRGSRETARNCSEALGVLSVGRRIKQPPGSALFARFVCRPENSHPEIAFYVVRAPVFSTKTRCC